MDELLGLHTQVVAFELQTWVERGIALLAKLLQVKDAELPPAVAMFPEHLRFGVPTAAGRILAGGGVAHRLAAVELGRASTERGLPPDSGLAVFHFSRRLLMDDATAWCAHLGNLVCDNTLRDLTSVTGEDVQF